MTRELAGAAKPELGTRITIRLIVCALLVTPLLVAARAASPASAAQTSTAPTDDFNRADGGLGSNWSTVYDPLSISGQAVVGSSGSAGAIRIGETYAGDQSSQIEVTSTQLSGGQYIGAAVRMKNGGQDMYLGIYYWNNGAQQLRLYKSNSGNWTQLGGSFNSGPLAAGTQLKVTAVGSTISFLQDGVVRVSVTDSSITGGAPGILNFGTAKADNWVGGGAGPPAATYSVGGTVSGLSGTVVLQDNGGDDLTLSANGVFGFATELSDGSAYSVTVQSNPTGQSCSVSNRSGTVAGADVTSVAVACSDTSSVSSSDDFNRADGGLGSNWSTVYDPLSISGQAVVGSSGSAGAIRIGETYAGDQSSQIEVTSTQLSGGQYIGAAVRMKNGGQDMYLGIYYWNNGAQQLRLYKSNSGNWTQLGGSFNSGPLAAGTQLKVTAVGSTISFLQDGVVRVSVTDSSITGGAPGILNFGTAKADNWVGGGAGPPAATYSVGGTVSGLSGTVVLQDNGGDDLTLSANGVFGFATELSDGSAYSVTVQSNPTGQSCSVSNRSGTVAGADVTSVAVACSDTSSVSSSDDFNRADGGLGSNWSTVYDPLSISGQAVVGSSGSAGAIRIGETYAGDQSSQIEVTSTQLSGGQYIGAAVRMKNGGQDMYLGIYYWNNGAQQLRLYKSNSGNWTQLGGSFNSGPLAAGTQLKVTAVGSTISFLQDGVVRVSVTDSSITGGAPGILNFGTAKADNWVGGGAGPPAATYSVGGTVSGLSGTVVLQDNGGDDLTLSANGVFGFATELSDGSAYSVTVQSNPTGQSCSVSNRSGTVAGADVTSVAVACSDTSSVSSSDDFNRADGGLGSNWSTVYDPLSISGQAVVGSSGSAGAIRIGETYAGDQSSQIEVTSTQLSGGQYIGAAVRMKNGGQDMYLGIYYWNNGAQQLRLYKSNSGNWTQLGGSFNSGPLAAGTQLKVTAVGSTISFLQDGVVRVSVTDSSITGGAPGILNFGTAKADNWVGGGAGPPAATYSVGGTVSGLSGTVVLQDNGGDDLTLSANGVFGFATELSDGSAYSVTVQSNPTGQSCSVSNRSGTVAGADVTSVAVACSDTSSVSSSDDFNRADGGLGSNWSTVYDPLSISGQAVVGSSGSAGAIRIGETYAGDQSSQIEVTSTQLSGGQYIGAAVRMKNGGQDMYLGIYYWNNGAQQLRLYKSNSGNWTQLGGSFNSGPLAAGTQLKVTAVGSTISFLQDGVVRVSVTDSSITGGAPGILNFGTAKADNWVGATTSAIGLPNMQVQYTGTDANGVASYNVVSADNGYGTQVLRVLNPSNPAPGVAHNFLFLLPVEPGLDSQYGDGIDTLRSLDAQNEYNLTIVEPTFQIDSWYANNATDPNIQYETFMTQDLVPWVAQNLSTTGHEQNWLIGFSKSGIGGEDLILKHPDVFAVVASWDFPADMMTYDQFGSSSADEYGTDASFQANYRLTSAFLDAHKAPFLTKNRIWIGGYSIYQSDMSNYDALLTSKGILHSTEPPTVMSHRWDGGWVQLALPALEQDSVALGSP